MRINYVFYVVGKPENIFQICQSNKKKNGLSINLKSINIK
jgi:hypothetical protein